MAIRIIDPLKNRIMNCIQAFDREPLFTARSKFGTETDLKELIDTFSSNISGVGERRYIYIDLTPFFKIGRVEKIVKELQIFEKIRPVILINHRLEDIEFKSFIHASPIVLVTFDQYGKKLSIEQSLNYPDLQETISNDLNGNGTLKVFDNSEENTIRKVPL